MIKPENLAVNDTLAISLGDQALHQGTWIASYQCAGSSEEAILRVVSFVDFCVDWSKRADRGEDPDPAEFDRFAGLMGTWSAVFEDGSKRLIEGAPTFDEYEVSFVVA